MYFGVSVEQYGPAIYAVLSPDHPELDGPALDQTVQRIAGPVTIVPTLI